MDRKSLCDKIILTKSEKRLLRYISKHPHTKCNREEIWPLYEMDLVCPDTDGVDAFNAPIPKTPTVCRNCTRFTSHIAPNRNFG